MDHPSLFVRSTKLSSSLSLLVCFLLCAGVPLFAQCTTDECVLQLSHGSSPYSHSDTVAVEQKINAIIAQLTLNQKLNYIAEGYPSGLTSFGVADLNTVDGINGVNEGGNPASGQLHGVVYPAGPALAASWNPQLAANRGRQLALDGISKGIQVVTGPNTNLYRVPFVGREAEYIAGEDPILGAVMATSMIEGQQSLGVLSDMKHYVANDQEIARITLNANIDIRTLHELYLPPFEAGVKIAQVASVMCPFPGLNGVPGCGNYYTETQILKDQYGFLGYILTDFNVTLDPALAALAGTDFDNPSGLNFSPSILGPLVQNGTVPMSVIDDKVRRIIRQALLFNIPPDALYPPQALGSDLASSEQHAQQSEEEGAVLLVNRNHLLPLQANSIKSIAVIGEGAVGPPLLPFGAANRTYQHYTTELDGIQAAVPGATVDVIHSMTLDPASTVTVNGWYGQYWDNNEFSGDPVLTRNDSVINFDWFATPPPFSFGYTGSGSAQWTGNIVPTISGNYVFKARGDGALTIRVNGTIVATNSPGTPYPNAGFSNEISVFDQISLQAGVTYTVTVSYAEMPNYAYYAGGFAGVQFSYASLTPPPSIANYDAVIVAAGYGVEYEGEGIDRPFQLPEFQSDLIANLAAANPGTIAIIHSGGGAELNDFAGTVGALLYAWYPGQNAGSALANLLFGVVTPSGKLPITLDRFAEDSPGYASYPKPVPTYYPYSPIPNQDATQITYEEGLFMGYRGYEAKGMQPLFPFGFGLSYTMFRYSGLRLRPTVLDGELIIQVLFNVTNTGTRAGMEAAQVYVGEVSPLVNRPVKELKGFAKQYLAPGETKQYIIPLNARAFAWYSAENDNWMVNNATFIISVGASSADIRLTDSITMPASTLSVSQSVPVLAPNYKR